MNVSLRDLTRRMLPSVSPGAAPALAWIMAALEAIVLCALALGLNCWIAPADPLGLSATFPWIWIVPALLAMRYGTAIGVLAVLALIGFWLLQPLLAGVGISVPVEFPKAFFLGGLVLTLICAQFCDVWSARTRRLRAVNAYLDERLTTLTKNHFLLRLSHERLEQDLLAKPLTLRETLARLRVLTAQSGDIVDDRGVLPGLPGAREFIQLLGQSCQLEIAAVHAATGRDQFAAIPSAFLGTPTELDQNDPLARYCLSEGRLAHVQTTDMSAAERSASRYLICAPLMPSNAESVGLLVVEKLPFFALNDDALQLLSVLIGYYADGVQLGHLVGDFVTAVPGCPAELALDMLRLHRIRVEAGIDSSLVALVFANDEASLDHFAQVKRLKRGVDLSWEITGATHSALITLLPLAAEAAVDGYLLRIEAALVQQSGSDFVASQITTHTARLGYAEPAETLLGLVRRCAL